MRIASYNIWNSVLNWPRRSQAIAEELSVLRADVVALQEVPVYASAGQGITSFFKSNTIYPHVIHLPYPDEPDEDSRPEGLAFLSRHPVREVWTNWGSSLDTQNNWAARMVVGWQGSSLGITNVHLNWQDASVREQHMVRIVDELIEGNRCDYDFLCGDFNDGPKSTMAQFLEGKMSIGGCDTQWRDLMYVSLSCPDETNSFTLDTLINPRWKADANDGLRSRFDRIYVHEKDTDASVKALKFGLFGKEPANRYRLVPSDHYGVFADLELALDDG